MILLDTHALLFWASIPEKLSSKAKQICKRVDVEGGFASSVSIWELGLKAKRGGLTLPLPIEEFARRIERHSRVRLVAVDTAIWLGSLRLEWSHRDPADRIIVATALHLGVPLLTQDKVIRRFRGVRSVW